MQKSASSLALGPGGLDIAQSFFKPIHGASQPSTTSRNTKISIIGVGNVGMAIAQTILTQELADEIAFVDVNADKLCGEMLDLQHAAAFLLRTTYSSTVGSDLMIVILPLPAALPEAILLIVSNPVDVLTYVAWKLSGLPTNRVIGSGTNLDSSRFRFLIADHLDVNAQDVQAFIMGEHGDSSVALWLSISVGGVPILSFLERQKIAYEKQTLEKIYKEVVQGAHEVIGLKGYTSWAIGYSVANLARTILRDQHKGESRALGVTNLHLSEEESQQLQKSAKTILEVLKRRELLLQPPIVRWSGEANGTSGANRPAGENMATLENKKMGQLGQTGQPIQKHELGDLSLGLPFPGDMSPEISQTVKLEGDTFPGDIARPT
nr:L-lactate dehydrogenase B-like [Tanacetum cinerariifolium]